MKENDDCFNDIFQVLFILFYRAVVKSVFTGVVKKCMVSYFVCVINSFFYDDIRNNNIIYLKVCIN